MKVSDLLDREEKWCQGAVARNALGNSVGPISPDACSWCLVGAVDRCYGSDSVNALSRLSETVYSKHGSRVISVWQDRGLRTFAEVRAVIEEANI